MLEFIYKRLFILVILLVMLLLYLLTSFEPNISVEHAEKSMARHRVGVMLKGSKDDAGWNQAHYEGFEKAAKQLDLDIHYKEHVTRQLATEVVEQLIEDGCKEIFITSMDYGDLILPIAEKNSEIKFFICSGNELRNNVSTYFGRIYQARYISGIMAGLATKSNHIAYIASYPYCEVIRGLNAFTLGVRHTNPQAVVHVRWVYSWDATEKEEKLFSDLIKEYPIDLVTYHANRDNLAYCADNQGIMSIGYNYDQTRRHPDWMLTAVVWDWSHFYTLAIRDCIEGKFVKRAYLIGIPKKGVNYIDQNEKLLNVLHTEEVNEARRDMIGGNWDVFYGPIYDQAGNLRLKPGETFSDDYLYNDMTWLVEGVEGTVGGQDHE